MNGMECKLDNLNEGRCVSIRVYGDNNIRVLQGVSQCGQLTAINEKSVKNLTEAEVQTLLLENLKNIHLEKSYDSSPVTDNHIFELTIISVDNGPIGIDLGPCRDEAVCGGLVVKDAPPLSPFCTGDIISAVNGICLNTLSANGAVELIRQLSDRRLTIVRTQDCHDHTKTLSTPATSTYKNWQNYRLHRHRFSCPMLHKGSTYTDVALRIHRRIANRPSCDYLPEIDNL
mmetsp:Transcript_16578/g.24939  ORF Transcript_16578/g.24939 Transcript_16578/m.24939 type:complete len:230 (+) Transcript_16578:86-775(+)